MSSTSRCRPLRATPPRRGRSRVAARVLASREARHGVLTNVVRPGFTLTDRALTTPGFGQAVVDAEAGKTPTRRICTPQDVANLVAYLGSAANGHVNGEGHLGRRRARPHTLNAPVRGSSVRDRSKWPLIPCRGVN
jgi:hypothetical protein